MPRVVIVLMVFAIASDTFKIRSPFIGAGLLLCLVGFAINISDAAIGVKYFGTFLCVSGSYSAITGIVAWWALSSSYVLLRDSLR